MSPPYPPRFLFRISLKLFLDNSLNKFFNSSGVLSVEPPSITITSIKSFLSLIRRLSFSKTMLTFLASLKQGMTIDKLNLFSVYFLALKIFANS